MPAYDIGACVVAGAALLLALPPLGKRLRRAIMSRNASLCSRLRPATVATRRVCRGP